MESQTYSAMGSLCGTRKLLLPWNTFFIGTIYRRNSSNLDPIAYVYFRITKPLYAWYDAKKLSTMPSYLWHLFNLFLVHKYGCVRVLDRTDGFSHHRSGFRRGLPMQVPATARGRSACQRCECGCGSVLVR